jgi:hypothetical protein
MICKREKFKGTKTFPEDCKKRFSIPKKSFQLIQKNYLVSKGKIKNVGLFLTVVN